MNRNRLFSSVSLFALSVFLLSACAAPKLQLFPDAADPLKEFVLSGKGDGKVLVVPIRGIIDDAPKRGFVRSDPSCVEQVVSQLRLAEKDPSVRALLLKIDSPGGTVTASDLLYHEIASYKARTGVKVVAALMNVGASGGYYIALAADRIWAHPTSITGSVGVVFMRPKLTGLMEKIGLEVEVSKSGRNKDMGSPFRPATDEEQRILQQVTDRLAEQFMEKVKLYRKPEPGALADVATARIYLAQEARTLNLVDSVGYLSEAISESKKIAGLPEEAKVVVYRRTEYANDTIYNPVTTGYGGPDAPLVHLGVIGDLTGIQAGFYYLWPAAVPGR